MLFAALGMSSPARSCDRWSTARPFAPAVQGRYTVGQRWSELSSGVGLTAVRDPKGFIAYWIVDNAGQF